MPTPFVDLELRAVQRACAAEQRAFHEWNRLRPGIDDEHTLARFEARWVAKRRAAYEAMRAVLEVDATD